MSKVLASPVLSYKKAVRQTTHPTKLCAVLHAFSLWFFIKPGIVRTATTPIIARVIKTSASVKAARIPRPLRERIARLDVDRTSLAVAKVLVQAGLPW